MIFTDTHSHIYSKEFETDIEEVILNAKKKGVTKIIIPSTSSKDYKRMDDLSQRYKGLFLAFGLHPTEIAADTDIDFEIKELESKIAEGNLVAIGETGLDLYWSSEFIEKQKDSLHAHIFLSIKHDIPLIIHTRDAFEPMFDVLENYRGKLKGVFHSFSGTVEDATRILDLGNFYFGIGGVVTFKNSILPEVVSCLPLDKLLLETDAPYLAPDPFRGKRNTPAHIPLIAEKIAQIKGINIAEVSKLSEMACKSLFRL